MEGESKNEIEGRRKVNQGRQASSGERRRRVQARQIGDGAAEGHWAVLRNAVRDGPAAVMDTKPSCGRGRSCNSTKADDTGKYAAGRRRQRQGQDRPTDLQAAAPRAWRSSFSRPAGCHASCPSTLWPRERAGHHRCCQRARILWAGNPQERWIARRTAPGRFEGNGRRSAS